MHQSGKKIRVATGLVAAVAVVAAFSSIAVAHDDDPKSKVRIKPYLGPGWRAATSSTDGGFAADGVTLMSWVPFSEFPGSGTPEGNDCWGYVSESGREYALMGMYCGVGVVEITDPGNAQVIDFVNGPCSLWGDIKVFGTYAYRTTESSEVGLQIIDLSDVDNGNVTLANDFEAGAGDGSSHNVAINVDTGHLYRTGGNYYGLGVYDLNADPVNPTFLGSWSDRYVHDAQVVTMESGPYAGKEIAFCCGGENGGWVNTGIDIIEIVRDGGSVSFNVLATYSYPNGAYSHQAWLSGDQQLFYLGDELDEGDLVPFTETKVIDVSDLAAPVEVSIFDNGNAAVGHNLYTRDGLIFEANYTSGLRVFDTCADPENPVEVAFFDTYPDGDGVGYGGLWSNFPYFPSGTVIGSDRNRGLFVMRIDVSSGNSPDIDGSGAVTVSDLLILLGAWGAEASPADLNCDNTVDVSDLLILLANWS